MDGFTFGKKEDKMGIRASATRELVFQDCRVHKSQLLGREGTGFITAMKTFDMSRPGVASQAVGIAAGALDLAVAFAANRKQFGQPVSSFQGLRFYLADMAMKVEAARALVYATARHIDNNPGVRPTLYSAMSKCFASDVAMEVTTNAVQVFGGHGYMREYPIEKYMRDAKITQIYDGHQPDSARRDRSRPGAGAEERVGLRVTGNRNDDPPAIIRGSSFGVTLRGTWRARLWRAADGARNRRLKRFLCSVPGAVVESAREASRAC